MLHDKICIFCKYSHKIKIINDLAHHEMGTREGGYNPASYIPKNGHSFQEISELEGVLIEWEKGKLEDGKKAYTTNR